MTQPSPAIVAQGAVRRLPRPALLLFCLAYVLPGFIGRAPWRSDDAAAFGYMRALASGQADWLHPALLGQAPDVDGLLPYWLGAWALKLAPGWIVPDFAVRLPFIGLLILTLAALWYGSYYLARSPQAQPVAFAFGGEARPADYARSLADGALLALIASLGLAQLSHETTPALTQLCGTALLFYAVAALPYHGTSATLAGWTGLLGLTLSGAPSTAVLLGVGSAVLQLRRRADAQNRPARARALSTHQAAGLLLAGTLLAALLASWLGLWRWRIPSAPLSWQDWHGVGSLLLWFTWPAWPLALWTVWRWRRQLRQADAHHHLMLPLWFASVTIASAVLTPAGDRALLLALPPLATLAAFALPTLGRSLAALVDWFTLLFFTGCAVIIWVVWIAMQTGLPPQPAANVARLAPGFEPRFIWLPFIFALLATLAWAWLVQWRVGRHRAAIWKSLVLPAGGAALCWLLLTTLWMPLLDFARSYTPLVRRIEAIVQPADCIETFRLQPGLVASLQSQTSLTVWPAGPHARCDWLLVDRDAIGAMPGQLAPTEWTPHSALGHPREGEEDIEIFRHVRLNPAH